MESDRKCVSKGQPQIKIIIQPGCFDWRIKSTSHLRKASNTQCLRLKGGSDPTPSERVPGFSVVVLFKILTYAQYALFFHRSTPCP
jgi:hypothetical protein